MKIHLEPPDGLKELSESTKAFAATLTVLAVSALALSIAALLIALGGRNAH